MAGISFNNFRLEMAKQNFDYLTGTIKVLAVDATYTFDADDKFVDDLTGELVNDTGTGYERKTLAGKVIEVVTATDIVRFLADNPTYTAINTTADGKALVAYLEVTTDADNLLMCYNPGVTLQTNGSDIEAVLEDGALLDLVDAELIV